MRLTTCVFLIFFFTAANSQEYKVQNFVGDYNYIAYEKSKIHLALLPNEALSKHSFYFQQLQIKYGIHRIIQLHPDIPELSNFYEVQFSNDDYKEYIINDLMSQAFTKSAEQIPVVTLQAQLPADYDPFVLWHLNKVSMTKSWEFQNKFQNIITVAVIDNGIRLSHEDLDDNLWVNTKEIAGNGIDDDGNGYIDDVNGWDASDNDNNANPPLHKTTNTYFSHGTHVAGLVAASTNNDKGIASIGLNTRIMAVKIVSDQSHDDSRTTNAYNGITFAMMNGADVINLSWGAYTYNSYQESVIKAALNRGCVVVAAAGNNNRTDPFYPAAFEGVIAVGATDQDDFKASYSNYGSWIDVMAPGNHLYSTLAGSDDAYGSMSGTSQAAPLVSGFVSLLLSQDKNIKTSVGQFIKMGCDNIDIENWNFKGMVGAGRINVDKTFSIVNGEDLIGNVSNVNDNEKLRIYPNPAKERVRISYDDEISKVYLIDALGKSMLIESSPNDWFPIPADLSPGMYVLKIDTKNGKHLSARLQVNR
jgi:subtilisin family serine protease